VEIDTTRAEAEDANRIAEEWAESERKYRAARREERRREWIAHHTRVAEALEGLAAEHRAAVGRLLDLAASHRGERVS
jgi:GAF domain-containing protein